MNWGKASIDFHLRRSGRRTLAITVHPDLSVVVKAPLTAGIEKVLLKGRFIWVHTPNQMDTDQVRKQLEGWYVAHAKARLTHSFAECLARLGVRLVKPPRMQVRRMEKRWGSWSRHSGVWLNPELIKTPASCIDYVVTHELCHAVHGNHGKRFFDLLRRTMPDWEQRKARLERVANG